MFSHAGVSTDNMTSHIQSLTKCRFSFIVIPFFINRICNKILMKCYTTACKGNPPFYPLEYVAHSQYALCTFTSSVYLFRLIESAPGGLIE